MSDHDDEPVGQLLTRREVLKLLGLGSAALLLGRGAESLRAQAGTNTDYLPLVTTGTGNPTPSPTPSPTVTPGPTATATATQTPVPSCVVRPEQTEGPYFLDGQLNRSDIRVEPTTGVPRPGTRLDLAFNVSQVTTSGCFALSGAVVDIWHCDASGNYSGVGGMAGLTFLRGYQITDGTGLAQFITIYPGWYSGRTVHIHFKIRVSDGTVTYDFTSQLYFDDDLTDIVYQAAPYNVRGLPDTRNNEDNIYANGGPQLTLELTETNDGYSATFNVGLLID